MHHCFKNSWGTAVPYVRKCIAIIFLRLHTSFKCGCLKNELIKLTSNSLLLFFSLRCVLPLSSYYRL